VLWNEFGSLPTGAQNVIHTRFIDVVNGRRFMQQPGIELERVRRARLPCRCDTVRLPSPGQRASLRQVDLMKNRSKDMIVSCGSNIYPREVEATLLRHPDVSEVSVAGQRDAEWGEVLKIELRKLLAP
jgi:hypothetical protein